MDDGLMHGWMMDGWWMTELMTLDDETVVSPIMDSISVMS
jgi:hypothetical protein